MSGNDQGVVGFALLWFRNSVKLFNGSMAHWLDECKNISLGLRQVALVLSVSVQDCMN